MKRINGKPPGALFAYLVGLVLLGLWGLLPSEVETSYDWQGALIAVALVGGLCAGNRACRWVLIFLGIIAAGGTLLIQSTPLELVATAWSVLVLAVTALLMTPAMRKYTAR